MPTEQDKNKRLLKILRCLGKSSADPCLPFGRFARTKKKEKDTTRLGPLWPNFKFKFESPNRFEN
jgi:hypothetical protein